MFEIQIARARHWAGPLGAGVVLFILARSGGGGQGSETWGLILYGLAGVLGLWALVNFGHQFAQSFLVEWRAAMESKFKLSKNFEAEIISRMNSDQLRAWGRGGQVMINVQPWETGPVEMIRGENNIFFLYTAWFMLKHSTGRYLYPIHNFKEGTFHFDMWGDHAVDDYTQAREFTAYLVLYGWASWARGSASAMFAEGLDAEQVMGFFGLEPDSYGVEEIDD